MSKSPSGIDLKAEAIRAELLAIAASHDGALNPHDIVQRASDPDSALHDEFEWNDDDAAEAYRLAQAGALVRRIKLTIVRPDGETKLMKVSTVRAYQSRPSMRHAEGGYETVGAIISDPDKRAEMVRQVVLEMSAYRKRYSELVELENVWVAISEAVDIYAPVKKTKTKGKGKGDAASANAP